LPVAQTAPAGHPGAEAEVLRQPLPADAGREHEQDPIQRKPVADPLAARIAAAAWRSWQ
jgi:hypothetical protein